MKMINWESCKLLKFDHTDKWLEHKPENKTDKIHKNFEIN